MTRLSAALARRRELRTAARWMARWTTPPPPGAFAGFGDGSVVDAPHRVETPQFVRLGDRVHVEPEAWLSAVAMEGAAPPLISLGDDTTVGRHSAIACTGSVEIGAQVWIGDGAFIGDSYHEYRSVGTPVLRQGMSAPRPVRIGDRVVLGPRCVVLGGVTVGDEAVIDAGAVVTADVPARCRATGNPARVVATWSPATSAWEPV